MKHRIAIYDLDRTVLATPTFTAFLLYAAQYNARWRLIFLPIWVFAMLGYAAKLYNREALKPFGIRLFLGRRITKETMASLAEKFANMRVETDIQPGAKSAMEQDRSQKYRLILATAAPEFYACHLGERLGFEAVIATRHQRTDAGEWKARLLGANCYGKEKRRRVEQWLEDQGIDRGDAHIRFYTDDISDAPTLHLADEGFAINPSDKFAQAAKDAGWQILDFKK